MDKKLNINRVYTYALKKLRNDEIQNLTLTSIRLGYGSDYKKIILHFSNTWLTVADLTECYKNSKNRDEVYSELSFTAWLVYSGIEEELDLMWDR